MRFLTTLFISSLLALCALGALNYSVDPTGIRQLQGAQSACGSGMRTERRWTIPLSIHYNPSGAIISGTSRMMRGFNEESLIRYFDVSPVVNAGLPSMTADELYWLLSPALANGRVQHMLLGIEFGMFSGRVTTRDHSVTEEQSQWQTVRQLFRPYLSLEASQASLQALRRDCSNSHTHASGFREPKIRRVAAKNLPHGFIHMGEQYINARYQSSAFLPQRYQHRLELFSRLLDESCQQHVQTDMIILPLHQRIHAIYHRQGIDNEITQWKQDITRISMRYQQAGCPVRLVDFSEPDEISRMTLTHGSGQPIGNHWHYEPSHFTPALGDCILHALQGNSTACTKEAFGRNLLKNR